jgi:antirestriction protein ArdC
VKKGEHGSLVVYADRIIRTETDAKSGEESERATPFMKGYTVFNVEQIEGLPEHFYGKPAPRTETVQRIERAEFFFAATGAAVRHGGNQAFYSPTVDHVQMPPIEAFCDAEPCAQTNFWCSGDGFTPCMEQNHPVLRTAAFSSDAVGP